MKKKIEMLLHEGRLSNQPDFKKLHQNFQSTGQALKTAKQAKSSAKSTYRKALERGEKEESTLLELLSDFRKAKYMHRYHGVEADLAKHHLYRWVSTYLANSEAPAEAKPKKKSAVTSSAKEKVAKSKGKQENSQIQMVEPAAGKTAKKAGSEPTKKDKPKRSKR